MSGSNTARVVRESGQKIAQPRIGFNGNRVCPPAFDDAIVKFKLSASKKILRASLRRAEIDAARRATRIFAIAESLAPADQIRNSPQLANHISFRA